MDAVAAATLALAPQRAAGSTSAENDRADNDAIGEEEEEAVPQDLSACECHNPHSIISSIFVD